MNGPSGGVVVLLCTRVTVTMDLLGSILGSMEKPPSASEKEKKLAKAFKAKQEREEEKERKKRDSFKTKVEKRIAKFLDDPEERRLKFPPETKVYRALLHEIAEAAGLISQAFGTEEVDRHIVLFKKEYAPTEAELQALRKGEEYDPAIHEQPSLEEESSNGGMTRGEQAKAGSPESLGTNYYQEKYKHLLGGLECAKESAVRMEPNKKFGYVPSSHKRDLRSIEQTLNDIKSRKKPRLDTTEDQDTDSSTPKLTESNNT